MVRATVPALILGCALGGASYADAETAPDMAFLEYLGMWDATDEEEWQLLEDDEVVESEEHSDSATEREASVEKDDED